MMRFASYPIKRAFTSIAMALSLLTVPAMLSAADADKGQIVGFEDAQGKALFLHDFKGKPVLINLWATWCAPCVQEMPSLAKLQQDYAAKGVVVIALSEDDAMSTATDFYKSKNITSLTPYLDKGHAVYTALEAKGLPTTVLINANGMMMQRIEGPVDWQSDKVKGILGTIVK